MLVQWRIWNWLSANSRVRGINTPEILFYTTPINSSHSNNINRKYHNICECLLQRMHFIYIMVNLQPKKNLSKKDMIISHQKMRNTRCYVHVSRSHSLVGSLCSIPMPYLRHELFTFFLLNSKGPHETCNRGATGSGLSSWVNPLNLSPRPHFLWLSNELTAAPPWLASFPLHFLGAKQSTE